jgi:hypothetical protein
MELVANYDSDDEGNISLVEARKPEVPTKTKSIKKKKLDIKILPLEIQLALTQSDSLLDSDDEYSNKNRNNQVDNSSKSSVKGLVGLLPKPKSETNQDDEIYKKPKTSIINQPKEEKESKEPISTSPYSKSLLEISNDEFSDSFDKSDHNLIEKINSDNSEEINEFSGSINKTKRSLFTFEEPKRDKSTILLSSYSKIDKNSNPFLNSTNIPLLPFSKVSSQISLTPSSESNNSDSNQSEYNKPISSLPPLFGSREAKRRREKDLESQLLNGNFDAIDEIETKQVMEVEGIGSWDSSKYEKQREREQEIQKSYNLTTGAISQPTKMQNRKHQINSLAFQAAKMELQMLESKGARMKTKYETQSKYGW